MQKGAMAWFQTEAWISLLEHPEVYIVSFQTEKHIMQNNTINMKSSIKEPIF